MVRRVIGYVRYESSEALQLLTSIFQDLRLFVNFFQPVMKVTYNARVGSTVRRIYGTVLTPYKRVLASHEIDQADIDHLTAYYVSLNPVELKRRIDSRLAELWRAPR